jgi:hypothetical protein
MRVMGYLVALKPQNHGGGESIRRGSADFALTPAPPPRIFRTLEPRAREVGDMQKIVARYTDGRVRKGHTDDLSPDKPLFHVLADPNAESGSAAEVSMRDLKAVFLVRDFKGNPQRQDRKHFAPDERRLPGRKVTVEFSDGEVLVGYTLDYQVERPAFFVTPADPGSNNERVLIVSRAVKTVRFL